MNLLITGSEGFIGKYFCNLPEIKKKILIKVDIKKGKDVYSIDIRNKNIAKLINSSSVIIHLAAISNDQTSKKNIKKTYDININGLKNLIEIGNKKKIKQFIFISTEWVYGEYKKNKKLYENTRISKKKLNSPYAITKIISEEILLSRKNNFPVTILRLGIVYGLRKKPQSAIEKICKEVKNKNKINIGSKKTARRYIHVQDVIKGIASSIGRDKNEIFNISGSQLITLGEIIEMCARGNKKKIKVNEIDKYNPSIRNILNDKAQKKLKWKPKILLKNEIQKLNKLY